MTDLAVNLDLLPRIVGILAPIVAIVLVGYLYGLRHNPEMAVANRINMDIFVPALILGAMASKQFAPERYIGLAAAAAILLLVCGLLARPVARWLKVDWRTFVPPMMFNNSANIGIPLAVLTWGESALPAAVILYTVSNVMHFSIGVHMLDNNARLLTLWRNPTLIAVAIGLLISTLQIPVWEPVVTSLQLLGNVAVPLLLFSLGVRMKHVRFNDLGAPLVGAFARPVLGMALAAALALALGLNERDSAMLLVFGALPPAVMNFLFAERYQQAPERVAAIVLIGNLAALLMLPLALMLAL
ncbi:AEC family transporter [Parahaliea mediterranea]|uniref:AEC family transporter n=1 Tax=Parahaliea mediterranea TaxID=651086 RepID=UPI001882C389|nr:AEC family transporter [Parahaliea mediterranea]